MSDSIGSQLDFFYYTNYNKLVKLTKSIVEGTNLCNLILHYTVKKGVGN